MEEIIDFHYQFEAIHAFQDGNGRIGRLIMFKEYLKNNLVPFIIDDSLKLFYYRGLSEWVNEKGYLIDTCLSAQDKFKKYLDHFKIPYYHIKVRKVHTLHLQLYLKQKKSKRFKKQLS